MNNIILFSSEYEPLVQYINIELQKKFPAVPIWVDIDKESKQPYRLLAQVVQPNFSIGITIGYHMGVIRSTFKD